LKPIAKSLKQFEYEIEMEVGEFERATVKFFLVSSVFDKPAKSAVINVVAGKGFYSCHYCLQSGESVKTTKSMHSTS
jgi:hypothetical protein